MEKLNLNIFLTLKNKFKIYIAGPKGSFEFHGVSPYIEFPFKPLWLYVLVSFVKVNIFALKTRPQVIFCGSGTSIFAGYVAARFCSAKVICYLHGLDIVASNILYRSLFVPLIKKSDLLIVNSRHTRELAISAGITAEKIRLLSPGVGFPSFDEKEKLAQNFRNRHGLDDKEFILIAGRITARKGIVEFIEQLFVHMLVQRPNLILVIVGEEAQHAAKSSQGVTEAIYQVISRYRIEGNVILTGGVSEQEFSGALFSASTFIFPVLNLPNDVEGFGMVAIEAAAHGVPTVGFAVGGVPDAIENGVSGWLVDSGDYPEMGRRIFACLDMQEDLAPTPESCRLFAKKFEWSQFGNQLQKIIESLS
jgi:phosphatidyl-myo-inositol dimannoside synthase